MKNNASLRELGKVLEEASSILVFPHISPDGDGLGSAAALCITLRELGKDAHVVIDEKVPEFLSFLPLDCVTQNLEIISNPDATICVDCSDEGRLASRFELYSSGKNRLCIDHHISMQGFGDMYYIDESAAAAAQLIFSLIDEMGWELTVDAAACLYTGIVTDTGSFQYSNTTPETHIIAGALIARGVDINSISIALYQNKDIGQMKTESRILDNMEIFADGKGAISYITNEELASLNTTSEAAEHAVDILRNIKGVQVAAFLKEKDEAVKVSMRSKLDFDVQNIARVMGGGGHKKAAGCTINENMEKAVSIIKDKLAEALEK